MMLYNVVSEKDLKLRQVSEVGVVSWYRGVA